MQAERYLGYLRVSTEEQALEGAGLDAQRAAIESEAARRGWPPVRFIEDAGRSGKHTRRPGLELALDLLAAGEATGLIVSKMDRLSRSMLDFAQIMDEARRQGWTLVALDCPVDSATPMGEALASMSAIFAQLERRLIGQRTKEALAVRKAQGVRIGRPPAVPQDVRIRIGARRAAGDTLRAIADALTAEGVPTAHGGNRWYPSTVGYVLRAADR